jgi:nucleoid DNA-binding protein
MARISLQELANFLVEKQAIAPKEARMFVGAIFDIIQQGIKNDKLVKVKGLGTFKVIGVEARKSINVNTGESVLIDSHEKVTFTPDTFL